MKNLTWPNMCLHFMRLISLVIDNTHDHHHFLHLTIQVQSAAREMSAKFQAVFLHDIIAVPLMTTTTITAFVDHSSEMNTIGTVTPVGRITEAARLLISFSMSTTFDKK